MGTVTYEVMREHLGDRQYVKGDMRELEASDAKHLVESGVLKPAGGEDLVERAKAERAAPQNKAEPVPDFNKTKPRVPRE